MNSRHFSNSCSWHDKCHGSKPATRRRQHPCWLRLMWSITIPVPVISNSLIMSLGVNYLQLFSASSASSHLSPSRSLMGSTQAPCSFQTRASNRPMPIKASVSPHTWREYINWNYEFAVVLLLSLKFSITPSIQSPTYARIPLCERAYHAPGL